MGGKEKGRGWSEAGWGKIRGKKRSKCGGLASICGYAEKTSLLSSWKEVTREAWKEVTREAWKEVTREASLLSTSEAGKERGNKVSIRRFLWPEETRKGETERRGVASFLVSSFHGFFPVPSPFARNGRKWRVRPLV